ncbi:MAG: hypothetical protein ABL907_07835 [Hyphomicrobium sp.]
MKMRLLIAVTLLIILCIGGGVSIYLWPGLIGLSKRAGHEAEGDGKSASATQAPDRVRNNTIGKLVRELGEIQDRIAQGQPDALVEQQRQFSVLADEFDKIDAGNWQSMPNTDDILIYVLSGGEPDVLRRFVRTASPDASEKRIVDSVLNFVEQNDKESLASFGPMNVLELRPGIAGPVALAKASLLLGTDDKTTSATLDLARLVSPNTAVEEAALRRQIPIVFAQKNFARGLLLMTDYVARYGKSLYAPKFFQSVVPIVVKNDTSDGTKFIDEFADAVEGVDDQVACDVLLSFARTFLAQGRLSAVKAATSWTLKRANASDLSKNRARLYLAAAEAPSEKAGEVAATLGRFNDSALSEEDQGIRRVAGDIASSVVSDKLAADPGQHEPAIDKMGASQSDANKPVSNGPLPRTERLLKEIEKLSQAERL